MDENSQLDDEAPSGRPVRVPHNHRTIDRVTHILEEVVYNPGMTLGEIVRKSGAAKSSIYSFVSGLVASGWLYQEQNRFYLGPAVYGLTLASGHIRAGLVTHADLAALQARTGLVVFLGVRAGDNLIYIDEAGSDDIENFEARTNIRRTLLDTAGGKVLLAELPRAEAEAYLRRRAGSEAELIDRFLADYESIRKTGIATNVRRHGARFAISTAVRDRNGRAVAAITFVGPTLELEARVDELGALLLETSASWSNRMVVPREAI
jgi:DNA-binding IclR family transcriptional regulator